MPALFISHGTPMLAFGEGAFPDALREFARTHDLANRTRAVVIVSAHGLSEDGTIEITANERHSIIHDFSGFPPALYQIDYPCPGSPETAVRAASLLADAGFQTQLVSNRRLDHGVWVPLKILFPEANVPVVQISIPYHEGPRMTLKLGHALASLRGEGVLLIGSGGAVHNLRKLRWEGMHGEKAAWAQSFEDWLKSQLAAKNVEALVEFESTSPDAGTAHPTTEHFYPVLFPVGAAWQGDRAVPIYEGIEYHSLSMFSFAMMAE